MFSISIEPNAHHDSNCQWRVISVTANISLAYVKRKPS